MVRKIEGLLWAREIQRPASIPLGRPRGAKAAGLRYQRLVEQALPEGAKGCWFEFEDKRGRGVCETDHIIRWGRALVVLEVKHSWTLEGHQQLEWLYLPILQHIIAQSRSEARRVVGVQVTKKLKLKMPQEIVLAASLEEAIGMALSGHRSVWHWLGRSTEGLPQQGAWAA